MPDVPMLGQIALYPYTFPPLGWLDCAGQVLQIAQYSALFSLLGTTYGGDGKNTFALPDLRGRAIVGTGLLAGGQTYPRGGAGGAETVLLAAATLPPHTHSLAAVTSEGSANQATGAVLAAASHGPLHGKNHGNDFNSATPNTTLTARSVGTAGGGLPHDNLQPTLVLRYCIATNGFYPTRG